jgi:hypothetical protein
MSEVLNALSHGLMCRRVVASLLALAGRRLAVPPVMSIAVLVGVILALLGTAGHAVGGRGHYF